LVAKGLVESDKADIAKALVSVMRGFRASQERGARARELVPSAEQDREERLRPALLDQGLQWPRERRWQDPLRSVRCV
jgi:hypothetical protein